jgi:hypothetical protein
MSKILLNLRLEILADQILGLDVHVGDDQPYVTQVAGLSPTITIELDDLGSAPIDPVSQNSKSLILLIETQASPTGGDTFNYIEVDGTIIP